MNNDRFNPFIRRFIKTWVVKLGLTGWTIVWTWATQSEVDTVAGYSASAVTAYDASMQEATVRISRDLPWQTKDRHLKGYLPAVILHELIHIRMACGEILLGDAETMFGSYLPDAVAHTVHQAATAIREFYVDAVVALLLNQEERWRLQKSR